LNVIISKIPWNEELKFLEVNVQQDNFKILQLLPQVLILFLVEKWIPPSRSKTAQIGQKTEGILGVNYQKVL
jgi:hypothetical protein